MARVPLYKAAETELIRRIQCGEWEVGHRLPNEFILADEFGVSQGTMRRALMSLEGMGLLNRKPGRGTLVSKPNGAGPQAAAIAPMALRSGEGAALSLEVFRARAGTRGADPEEADLFGASRLSTLQRTLRRSGERAALDEVLVPEALIPALDEEAPTDLAELLADAGVPATRIEGRVAAAMTTMGESVALSCDRHTALLVLTRTACDADGQAIARQTLRIIAGDVTYGAA